VGKAIVITGIREIDRKLKTLEARVQKKILRRAMRTGMKVVLAEAQALVPVLSGLTKENLKLRAGKRSRNKTTLNVQVANAEGLTKETSEGKKFFYPAVVEWGHDNVPPHPFMRPAYDTKGPEGRDKTMNELLEGTLREAAK
jgi:HK97 gp10 family phage protein